MAGVEMQTPPRKAALPRIAKTRKRASLPDMVDSSAIDFRKFHRASLMIPNTRGGSIDYSSSSPVSLRSISKDSTTSSPATVCQPLRFLDFPPDIRMMIYEWRYRNESFTYKYEERYFWSIDERVWRSRQPFRGLKPNDLIAILQTCRLCHKEASMVLNRFVKGWLSIEEPNLTREVFERLPSFLVSWLDLWLRIPAQLLAPVLPAIIKSASKVRVLKVDVGLYFFVKLHEIGTTWQELVGSVELQQQIFGDVLAVADYGVPEARMFMKYMQEHNTGVKLLFNVHTALYGGTYDTCRFAYSTLDIEAGVLQVRIDHPKLGVHDRFDVPQKLSVTAEAEAETETAV